MKISYQFKDFEDKNGVANVFRHFPNFLCLILYTDG